MVATDVGSGLGHHGEIAMPRGQYQSAIVDGSAQLIREIVRQEVRAALAEHMKAQQRATAKVGRIGLRIEDACEAAGVGETVLRAAIRAGTLRARKRGRSTIILEPDLRQYLASLPLAERGNGRTEGLPR
jgi:hypothetical protein